MTPTNSSQSPRNPATADPDRKEPARENGGTGAAIHVLASGRVQGVGFRHFVRLTGDTQGCAGWVRNLPDGRVEAVVAGPADAVQATLDAIARGPHGARVDGVVTRLALEDERAQVRRPFALRRDA